MKNKLIVLMVVTIVLWACDEEPVGQQPTDNVAPGLISNVEVENISGGAILTYSVPEDEDLLYVKAVYSRKEGQYSESKASVYSDTLKIEGFGDTNEHLVDLIAVDRSRNESDPVSIKIKPLEPAVNVIGETLTMIEDFGGISASWYNENNAEISIVIQERDTVLDEIIPLETYYSKSEGGKFAIYGLDTIAKTVEVYVQDRWENRSPIKKFTITPLYETQLEKSQFAALDLPGDGPHHGDWVISNIWNGTPDPNGYSSLGGQGIWPQSITIDLGVLAKLSRVKVYQRKEDPGYIYAEGNLRKFEIWGSETIDFSGSYDSWIKLGDFESIKPSGLPFGQVSDEDVAVATNGEDFAFPSSNPKIRYIRIKVTQTWAGGDNFQIMELDIFGDNR